jgi:hypothetical protein
MLFSESPVRIPGYIKNRREADLGLSSKPAKEYLESGRVLDAQPPEQLRCVP